MVELDGFEVLFKGDVEGGTIKADAGVIDEEVGLFFVDEVEEFFAASGRC